MRGQFPAVVQYPILPLPVVEGDTKSYRSLVKQCFHTQQVLLSGPCYKAKTLALYFAQYNLVQNWIRTLRLYFLYIITAQINYRTHPI